MKIAMCLIGIVGGSKGKNGSGDNGNEILEIGFEHYRKHLLSKNSNVDVFVHTWSKEFKEEITDLYKPKLSKFEKQKRFNIPKYVSGKKERKNNHYSRWYSYNEAIKLKSQFEKSNNFKYDFVFVTRFDLAFQKDIVFSDYDPKFIYAGKWCRMYDGDEAVTNPSYYLRSDQGKLTHKHVGYPFNKEGLIDQWFFGGSDNMNKFCGLYERLDKYLKPGCCPNDSAGNISNHQLALYHIKQIGMLPKLKFTFCLHDDFPLIRRMIFKSGK